MLDIFFYIYGGSFWENLFLIIFLIYFFRRDIYIILVVLSVQNNMKRKIVDVETLF